MVNILYIQIDDSFSKQRSLLVYILDPEKFPPDSEYPGLYSGDHGPTKSAMRAAAEGPRALFFYVMPKRLWAKICLGSNAYHKQQLFSRAERIQTKQKMQMGSGPPETRNAIRARLAKEEAFEAYEYTKLVGLLIAHMLCPHKQRLSRHWSPTAVGAVPAGTFGKYITWNRFNRILP